MALPQPKIDGAEALLARAAAAQAPVAPWAQAVRDQAEARLRATGGPVRRDEYWRYTDPAPFMDAPNAQVRGGGVETGLADLADLHLVFADGEFDAGASTLTDVAGLERATLADALGDADHWSQTLFGRLEEAAQTPVTRPLAIYNTARATQGVSLRATAPIPTPVALSYTGAGGAERDHLTHHVIKVEPGARLTLLENGPAAARCYQTLEVEVAEGGAFHHIRLQGPEAGGVYNTHIFARLAGDAVFKSFTLSAHGAATRNECVITFTGDDAHATVAGAALGAGTGFHHDDTVFVTHDAVNCESRQVFKKVLRDGATGVFQGKILVKPDAQKTDGYQISQGLLLDEASQFLAKPELEIYADDVACSHGSTCGAVDETALFYLTSRGVPRAQAQDMLILAFIDEAIQEVEDEGLADAVRTRLRAWLGAEPEL